MISHRQCISPLVSVDPMYIAGRFRTASSPSSTSRCRASYSRLSVAGLAVGTRREYLAGSIGTGAKQLIRALCRRGTLAASQRRFTGFVTQQSLARDGETEQSETDEMLKGRQGVSQPR